MRDRFWDVLFALGLATLLIGSCGCGTVPVKGMKIEVNTPVDPTVPHLFVCTYLPLEPDTLHCMPVLSIDKKTVPQ